MAYAAPAGGSGKRGRDSEDIFKSEDSDNDSSDNLFVSQRSEKKPFTDDSDAESDGDGIDIYNEKMEPLPKFAAYDPEVHDIVRRLLCLVNDKDKIFTNDPCITPEVMKLLARLIEVQTIPDGQHKEISLLGEAGQGKSSFINAITDIPRLAKAMDVGRSVTFVVMIYQQASKEQRLPFSARIEYFDIDTITKILEEAIMDWYAYYFDKDDSWSKDEEKDRRDRAQTTRSIFQAVFRDLGEFSTPERAGDMLDRICSMPSTFQEKAAMFVNNVKNAMDRMFPHGKYEAYQEADNQDDLREWLDPQLTDDEDCETPSMWSFVKRVVIGVRDSRVLDRWTIADLPGLTDTHQVRVNATLNHISQSDHLFVVGRLGRIVTNPAVRDIAQKYGHAFGDNFSIIATKCDENVVDPEVVKELTWKQPDLLVMQKKWKTFTGALDKEIKSLSKPKSSQQSFKKAKSMQDGETLEKIATLTEERKRHDNEWWESVVKARNLPVMQSLGQDIQQYLPASSRLKVFCISNTHYESLKDAELHDAKFQLSAKGTGIPGLRFHLLKLAAPARVQSLQNFINHQFTVFIEGCALWASNKLVEGREELILVVKRPQKAIPGAFEECLDDMQADAQQMILSPLVANQAAHAEHAITIVEKNLSKRHWATLKAFIRRYGHHQTPSMVASWNELFTETVRVFLNSSWDTFQQGILKRLSELGRKILATVSSIMQLLDQEKAALGLPTDNFATALKARVEGLRQDFQRVVENLGRRLRTVRINATVDGPSNYFRSAMSGAYELCQDESGTGVKARCMGILKGHIALQAPFATMANYMQENINQAFEDELSVLQHQVDDTFEQITQDFASMIRDKKQSASEAPVREAIKGFLETAVPEFESIKRDFDRIKAKYPAEISEE